MRASLLWSIGCCGRSAWDRHFATYAPRVGYFDGMSVLGFALLVATVGPPAFALVDASIRRDAAFRAAGKLTKPAWLLMLALATVFAVVFRTPTTFVTIAGTIAAIVYIVDVRPAVQQMGGPRRPGGTDRW